MERNEFSYDDFKEILEESIDEYLDKNKITRPLPTLEDSSKDNIFDNLPNLLKKACSPFNGKDKDILLMSSLTVLSGLFHNMKGFYHDKMYFTNLYFCLVAESGQGKGLVGFAKQLGSTMREAAKDDYESKMTQHKQDVSDYELEPPQRRRELEEPEKPTRKVIFENFPITNPALIKHLDENESLILHASEIDKLVSNIKTNYGDITSTLREAFHHEEVGQFTKTDDVFLESLEPCISCLITGTPRQANALFEKNMENGLFSRFMFYINNEKGEWKDPWARRREDSPDVIFKALSHDVQKIASLKESEMVFTSVQKKIFNKDFNERYETLQNLYGTSGNGLSTRFGVMFFRIAMILTNIRRFEEENYSDVVECNDDDFWSAYYITIVFSQHSIRMFTELDITKEILLENRGISDITGYSELYSALPKQFTSKQAYECMPNRSKSSITNYLKLMQQKGLVVKVKNGLYEKK